MVWNSEDVNMQCIELTSEVEYFDQILGAMGYRYTSAAQCAIDALVD